MLNFIRLWMIMMTYAAKYTKINSVIWGKLLKGP
jgi:hypothetical protein